jgi:hypothetical protein
MKGKLKPCPFCGHTPNILITKCKANNFSSYKVKCLEFDCRVNPATTNCMTETQAKNIWNKRGENGSD